MDRERLYGYLPIVLQNVACSLEGWRINRERYDADFDECLSAACARALLSSDEVCAYRDARLRAFLQWSVDTVPYYEKLFRKLGAHPMEFTSLDDLNRLPVLTKRQVQDNPAEFVSKGVRRHERVIAHTSGSTGGGLRFATTKAAIQEQFAVSWRYLGWYGFTRDRWRAYFGGRSIVPARQMRPPFWRYNVPGKQILFSGYHLSEQNLPYYVETLNERRPSWLIGYPSSIAALAEYLLGTNASLAYALKGIALCSENLMPRHADAIERAFGIRPVQDYGQAEAVANMSQCLHGNLHVDEDFAAVEFIPVDADGTTCRVIGTNVSNLATPLIRYDTGDLVTVSGARCGCGRPGRVVDAIDGRGEDCVVLRNGTKIGRMDHVFKDLVNVREAQLYQKTRGAIEVRVVKGPRYGAGDEARLMSEMRKRVGEETDIRVVYVDRIARTSRGKLRFVISDIPRG
ncbi:MAG: hypothetical protein WC956_04790 [bacterium]